MKLSKENVESRILTPVFCKEKTGSEIEIGSKPWLDEKGNILSDEDLRLVNQTWSKDTWETYLKMVESPQSELILKKFDKVLLMHDSQISMNNFVVGKDDDATLNVEPLAVKQALLKLTYQQRQLAEFVFFKGLSITCAAEEVGITRQNASRKLTRARQRIKEILSQRIERANSNEEKNL